MLRRLPSDLQNLVYGFMDYGRSWERDDMFMDIQDRVLTSELRKVEEDLITLIGQQMPGIQIYPMYPKNNGFRYIQYVCCEGESALIEVREARSFTSYKKVLVHFKKDIEYEGQPNWVPVRIGTLYNYMDLSEIYEELGL